MGSDARNTHCVLDSDDFVNDTKMVIDFMANYYNKIEEYPVQSQVKPGYLLRQLPDTAPNCPESLEDILKDVNDSIIPGITHWQSPSFFAWFPASASTAGYVGEMLCSGLNVVGFNWIASPAATELENIVMDWMAKMLNLPSSFMFSGGGGGVLHGTTCEAIVCTLAAARDEVLKKYGDDKITKLVVYASDQTHSTVRKASKLVGIPPANFRSLVTTSDSGFTLSPQALQEAIEADIGSGLIPLFVCGTVGTTACGAVDPLEEVGKIARKYNLWFHVDAAYAGNACICPEFRHCLDGVELADSFSLNAHKWFLTNLSCCCLWVKDPRALVESLSSDPEYLRNHPSELQKMVDYKDWQIALTRRFNSLKLWVVIRRHGVANLRRHIRTDVNMAKRFETLVTGDNRFELVVPRSFALVCFRLKPTNGRGGLELNCKLLTAVNQSGRAFMTHAVVGGVYFIRCVVGSTLTEEHHVDALWTLIQEKASILLLQD